MHFFESFEKQQSKVYGLAILKFNQKILTKLLSRVDFVEDLNQVLRLNTVIYKKTMTKWPQNVSYCSQQKQLDVCFLYLLVDKAMFCMAQFQK